MTLRIGTLDDKLSVSYTESWCKLLTQKNIGFKTQYYKDDTDLLEILGQTGIPFYEMLHEALVENQIDAFLQPAVWTPLFLKEGLEIAAFLPREHNPDVLSVQVDLDFLEQNDAQVGVTDLRTKAQWKNKFPNHQLSLSQKDTNDRLQEVSMGDNLDGSVFNFQELDRLTFDQYIETELDWMVPAPGQGVSVLICRTDDEQTKSILAQFNDAVAEMEVQTERAILKKLGIDHKFPVGLKVRVDNNSTEIMGFLSDENAETTLPFELSTKTTSPSEMANIVVNKWMEMGATDVLKKLSTLNTDTI